VARVTLDDRLLDRAAAARPAMYTSCGDRSSSRADRSPHRTARRPTVGQTRTPRAAAPVVAVPCGPPSVGARSLADRNL